MRLGTRSVLYGAHAFYLHPFFVARAWWKLYGFPWQPWLWVAFAVHDIGYIGKPNMDGPEGEEHPRVGARILYELQGWWLLLRQPVLYAFRFPHIRWWNFRRRLAVARLAVARQDVIWGNEVLFHSRYLAKRYRAQPSRLCVADKLAIALTPAWLYLPMTRATGEIHEYMNRAHARAQSNEALNVDERREITSGDAVRWYAGLQDYMRRWVEQHRDGREDTWTASAAQGQADTNAGVWP